MMQFPIYHPSQQRNFFRFRKFLFFALIILFPVYLNAQSEKDFDPKQIDLNQEEKTIHTDGKEKKGCCKIKYTSGGYDFFTATEEECRANMYFDRFLGDKNSLCFQWKE